MAKDSTQSARAGEERWHRAVPLVAEFSCAVDQPVGRIDCVLSAVTGQPLRYFTPDSLADLLQRGQMPITPQRSRTYDPLLALVLVRAASTSKSLEVDIGQARRFARNLVAPIKPLDTFSLISLAGDINPSISKLREEIVFTGGRSSSSARHIYAPAGRLTELMESLSSALRSEELDQTDPLLASVIVGMFCSFSHPFIDGNGRWARLVSASTWRTSDAAWPAMIGAVFQNTCKEDLTQEVWPRSMTSGLREYLEAAMSFESEVSRQLDRCGTVEAVKHLNSALSQALKNRRSFTNVAAKLYSDMQIPIQGLREIVGISLRAANGLTERIVDETRGAVEILDDSLNVQRICKEVNDAVQGAAAATFRN